MRRALSIEAGLIGRLADHECHHGRLPFDRTEACGCWAEESATVVELLRPTPEGRNQRARRLNRAPCPWHAASSR